MATELKIRRAAKAAGITKEQAQIVAHELGDHPSGGPAYQRRMRYLREAMDCIGENHAYLSDAGLEKRLSKFPRTKAIIDYAKAADAALNPAGEGE